MIIWKQKITIDLLNKRNTKSLSSHLDISFIELGDDFLKASMPVNHNTMQPMGIMHGGSSCALAETTASAAANFCVEKDKLCVGLSLNINHIRPISSGVVTATATPIHLGRKTQVWEIPITDKNGKLISITRLTLAIIDKKDL